MSQKKTGTTAAEASLTEVDSPDPDLASLSQVRDILFGADVKRIDETQVDLAARLDRESAALKDEFRGHLEDLRREMHSGFEALKADVEAEHSDRVKSTEEHRREILDRLMSVTGDLEQAKLDRSSLATLLRDLADRL